jgi:hypothetical protein
MELEKDQWLEHFLVKVKEAREDWVKNVTNQEEREWATEDLEMSKDILDILRNSKRTISLTDNQASWLGDILDMEKKITEEGLKEEKDENGRERLKEDLGMVNNYLDLIDSQNESDEELAE